MIFNKGSRLVNGERIVFSTNGAGTIGYQHTKELIWTSTSYYIQKLIQNGSNLNVGAKTIKLLKGKIGIAFCDFALCNYFLNMTAKAQAPREKNKLDFIKIKNFYTSKDTNKKMKIQPKEWEKIFANHATDKGLISKI